MGALWLDLNSSLSILWLNSLLVLLILWIKYQVGSWESAHPILLKGYLDPLAISKNVFFCLFLNQLSTFVVWVATMASLTFMIIFHLALASPYSHQLHRSAECPGFTYGSETDDHQHSFSVSVKDVTGSSWGTLLVEVVLIAHYKFIKTCQYS